VGKNGTNVERKEDNLQIEAEQTGVMVVVFPKRGVGHCNANFGIAAAFPWMVGVCTNRRVVGVLPTDCALCIHPPIHAQTGRLRSVSG